MERPVLTDRRRTARRRPDAREPLCRVRLRTGRELPVVDISPAGVLVEGPARLLPNTHLDVHVVTRTGRVLVRCRVVRARVCHLAADAIRYQAALSFERPVDTTPGYGIPSAVSEAGAAVGSPYPPDPAAGDVAPDIRLSA